MYSIAVERFLFKVNKLIKMKAMRRMYFYKTELFLMFGLW